MKRLLLLLLVAAMVTLPVTLMAAVQGSSHDMTGGGDKLCFACHVPHLAFGTTSEYLWARDFSAAPGGFTTVQQLCWTCHNGTVTNVGTTTAFDGAKQQHKTVGSDCSGTGACHDVHDQSNGRFTAAGITETNGSYCETCHDATAWPGAGGLGDHTDGITHFTNGTTFTCNQCHTVHGATAPTTQIGALTNPILLGDNNNATYYGAFCIDCHQGNAPAEAVLGTGGQASTDPWNYEQATNDDTETSHPTITNDPTFPVGGCNKCHDVHDPTGTATGYLLMADNTDSGYCVSCHNGTDGPPIGNSHRTEVPADVNMNNGLSPALPWANQINEDGVAGADWPSATPNRMVCETCHSVHRLGNTGPEAEFFLRHENGTTNQLCRACHSDN